MFETKRVLAYGACLTLIALMTACGGARKIVKNLRKAVYST